MFLRLFYHLDEYPRLGLALRILMAFAVLGSLALGCGAKEATGPKGAVCWTKRPLARNGGFRPIRPTHWMNTLLKGFHWKRTDEALDYQANFDCSGESIVEATDYGACREGRPERGTIVPLQEDSAVERLVPTGERLVWIITHKLSNGDGLGPMALVGLTNKYIAVRALGHYRGRTERIQMHLWAVGKGELLVVESERCKDPKIPATCLREARILVRDGNRFITRPIVDWQGRCIEPAQIEYSKKADVSIESGWVRQFRYTASVSHDVRYLVVTEQIDINDVDPSQPDMPSRHVRRVDTERFIHLRGLRLVSRQGPLWRRMMPTRGSTELDISEQGVIR